MKSNLLFDFNVNKENNSIHIQKEFDADLKLVWDAWTKAELLDQWWGPQPWRAETKKMDFREGGSWLYAMVSPEGEKHWSKSSYIAINEGKSFKSKDGFCDENGTVNQDMPENFWENTFSETDDKSKVDIVLTFEKLADLESTISMGFKEGMTQDLQQLDELLAKLKK